MTRYKSIEQQFPYVVEMMVPLGGLRGKRDAINDFHARHGIKRHAKRGRYKDGSQHIRWCFADQEIAEAFAVKFAKVRLKRQATEVRAARR